jgi:PKHD-type hydroxylase
MLYQIPKRQVITTDTHAYYDNVFTEEELNKILALPEWLCSNKATIGGLNNEQVVNNKIRVSDVSWILPRPETIWIWNRIVNVAADINSEFFNFDLTGCQEPIQLGIYKGEENGNYDWHADSSVKDRGFPRKLSMSLILSDESEYEGGELQIKAEHDTPITLNTCKGRAWFFPSYTLHRVTPVTKGIRRSLVLWINGPAFK